MDPLRCPAAPGHDVPLPDEFGHHGAAQTARRTRDYHPFAFFCFHDRIYKIPRLKKIATDYTWSRLLDRVLSVYEEIGKNPIGRYNGDRPLSGNFYVDV